MEYAITASTQDRSSFEDDDIRSQTLGAMSVLPGDDLPALEGPMTADEWQAIFWMEMNWKTFAQNSLWAGFTWWPVSDPGR